MGENEKTQFGWATLETGRGEVNLELVRLLRCTTNIALTGMFDISEGKPIRKLETGEFLEVLEDFREDAPRNILRVRAKSQRDGKEGWLTTRGTHGTLYAEEVGKAYICRRST